MHNKYSKENFCKRCKKLDEIIKWANKKANNSWVKILAIITRLDKVSRFTNKALLDQTYTIELLS